MKSGYQHRAVALGQPHVREWGVVLREKVRMFFKELLQLMLIYIGAIDQRFKFLHLVLNAEVIPMDRKKPIAFVSGTKVVAAL